MLQRIHVAGNTKKEIVEKNSVGFNMHYAMITFARPPFLLSEQLVSHSWVKGISFQSREALTPLNGSIISQNTHG